LAVLDGKENIVQLLLDHGVDINVKDAAGLSPLELAKHIEVQKVI
jgi:ankyrin repeat protein